MSTGKSRGTNSQARHPLFQVYQWGMVGAGGLLICLAFYRVLRDGTPAQWLILAGLTILTSPFSIKIPGVNSKIAIGDTFYFTNVILYGPWAGIITAAMEALMGSVRARTVSRRLEFSLFNISAFALSAFAAGSVFFRFLGRGPLFAAPTPPLLDLILPVGLLALVHYLMNSGSVAAILALEGRKNIYQIWKDCFLWTSITYFVGAAAAGIIALNLQTTKPEVLGVIAPVIAAVYYTYKTYLDKVLQLNKLYINTVESLAMAIDAKDQITHGHVRRVQIFAHGLAKAMGVQDEESLRWVEAAALLHDIGKLAVPEYILNKPGKLTRTEFKKVMGHSAIGGDILSSIRFPYDVARDVRHHHEHWDGSGYPDGLRGDAISVGARILAVVDAYDAMTSDRPYRAAMSHEEAMSLIRAQTGAFFDPEVVRHFDAILDDLVMQASALDPPERIQPPAAMYADRASLLESVPISAARSRTVFQSIVATHREVSALFDLAQTLGSTLHLDEILSLISCKIARLLPFDTCVIYMHSVDKGLLTAEHVSGLHAEAFKGYSMEFGKNLSGWVAAHNHPAINADPVFDILPLRSNFKIELKNSLVFPLNAEGSCIGVIALYAHKGLEFSDDHVRIMEVVIGQVARAIYNAIKYEETQVDALTDRLTSLPNVRYLDLYFDREMEKARRFKYPLSILAMDLDRFKDINDRYGHHVGDLMLLEVAKVLNKTIRASDVVIRYGGDEFIAVVSQTAVEEAGALARRIQREIESIRLPVEGEETASVGISFGAASFPEDADTLSVLLQKADQAMYQNKEMRKSSSVPAKRHLELIPMRRA